MPSWWGKSSSKKRTSKESFIDTFHLKIKTPSEGKPNSRSAVLRRNCSDITSEKGSQPRVESRSPSSSKRVSRCQSLADRPHSQTLPLPDLHPAIVGRTGSGIGISTKTRPEKGSKSSLFLPLPRPGCIRCRPNPNDLDGDYATASVSSGGSAEGDDSTDLQHHMPLATDYNNGTRTADSSRSSLMLKDQSSTGIQCNSRDANTQDISFGNSSSPKSPKSRPLSKHVPNIQIPHHGAFSSAPDSSMSSPSRSPMRAFGTEQVMNSLFWAGKTYTDVTLLGSGHCSSPGSGHNSGHNSMGGDLSGQLFWQQSRSSPEYSPIPSPRLISAGPSSRVHSGAVTPIHPRSAGTATESHTSWHDEGKQQSHRLPLPPITISNSSPFSHSNSAATSPSMPRSPSRVENPVKPGSRWKKGKLLGRGTFGHVYVGFNSESGEMCAMKEVILFSDDAKSKESTKQLMQEIALLSCLRHPNIVQYYGSEKVEDRLYIYLEYVSGGSIYKLLQEYGQLGEPAIRSYTQQILSGLAYLHSKSTVHRDIKGANILVDPNGRGVKVADFGMAKHIAGQSCPLSFKGSPYWMAPEVIRNSSGCNLAVDIWSLGCTVLEMATTKPPWSQYEGVAAMFKIGNSKELPTIPDYLSDEGKDFVRQCLQRNPIQRPTAAQLLDHPFVKYAAPLERSIPDPEPSDPVSGVTNAVKAMGIGQARNYTPLDVEQLAVHSSRVSPIGSPLLHSRSPQHLNGRMSPSPISSPRITSGSSTPLTGGTGAIPFGYLKQSANLQEALGSMPKLPNGRMSPSPISSPRITSGSSTPLTGGTGAIPFGYLKQSANLQEVLGSMPKPPNGLYVSGSSYNDTNPDVFRGLQPGSNIFSELVPSENDALGIGRLVHGEPYDGQSVLAGRVSRQLLKDHAMMSPSLNLSPSSPSPNQASVII